MVNEDKADLGIAVTLTNDPGYWRPSTGGTIDDAFRLHPKRPPVTGQLNWTAKAGKGTIKGREELKVRGVYPLAWRHYSRPQPEHEFQYLMLPVKKVR